MVLAGVLCVLFTHLSQLFSNAMKAIFFWKFYILYKNKSNNFKHNFIYLFLAVLGLVLHGRFSSCGGFSGCRVWALGHLGFGSCDTVLSSWGFQALEHRLKSSDLWAQLLCGMLDLPWSRIQSVAPALADGFFTTEPKGDPHYCK